MSWHRTRRWLPIKEGRQRIHGCGLHHRDHATESSFKEQIICFRCGATEFSNNIPALALQGVGGHCRGAVQARRHGLRQNAQSSGPRRRRFLFDGAVRLQLL